ncbi:hypothetical protein [Vibrio caribbeanicus]|uniref:hypothetical protein n=1 Tax=Vibrio caribbeanicus TaxID=701175 RepID=UPI0030DBDA94
MTHYAWRSQFNLGLVFKIQWFRLGVWRCLHLNAALRKIRIEVDMDIKVELNGEIEEAEIVELYQANEWCHSCATL